MVAVAVGVHEAHGDRLIGAFVGVFGQVAGEGFGLGLVKREEYRAVGADPLCEDMAVTSLDEGSG